MNIERYITKLEQIKRNCELIKEKLPKTFEEFNRLGLIKDGIYKRYEYSVELIIEIILMINSDFQLGIPNGINEVIDQLVEQEFLSSEIAGLIKAIKGFRNVLVHRYGVLDEELTFETIKDRLDDFEKIEKEILALLKKYKDKK